MLKLVVFYPQTIRIRKYFHLSSLNKELISFARSFGWKGEVLNTGSIDDAKSCFNDGIFGMQAAGYSNIKGYSWISL